MTPYCITICLVDAAQKTLWESDTTYSDPETAKAEAELARVHYMAHRGHGRQAFIHLRPHAR